MEYFRLLKTWNSWQFLHNNDKIYLPLDYLQQSMHLATQTHFASLTVFWVQKTRSNGAPKPTTHFAYEPHRNANMRHPLPMTQFHLHFRGLRHPHRLRPPAPRGESSWRATSSPRKWRVEVVTGSPSRRRRRTREGWNGLRTNGGHSWVICDWQHRVDLMYLLACDVQV